MKNSLKYLLFFSIVWFFSACTEDLNTSPIDPLVQREDEVFSQPGAYNSAIAGVYANLVLTGPNGPGSSNLGGIDAGFSQYVRVWWYFQNMTSDETIWSYEGDIGTKDLNRTSWSNTNPFFLGFYSRAMFQVALANEFLRQSTEAKLNARNISAQDRVLIAQYRIEARALRAMAYYHLIDTFGQAMYLTEENPVGVSGPIYNRQQLFTFVESELTAVIPQMMAPNTAPYGRADAGFARMILAKLYLNAQVYIGQNKNQECMTVLEPIMSAYSLSPNYLHNFTADNQLSPEMIFSVPQDGVQTQSYSGITVILNGQIGFIERNGAEFGMNPDGWSGALRIRKEFALKFDGPTYATDARNTIFAGTRPIDIFDIAARGQGYIIKKFSNKTSLGVAGSDPEFPDTDFPLFRLGDAYLMYAEAQLRKDGSVNATSLNYINALRTRANNTNLLNAGQVNLDFILDERSRELYWEGHRRQDLIRFGKFTGDNYTWQWKGGVQEGVGIPAHYTLFPFHPTTLGANSGLTQNPGY
jgi:hypothetical protein